MVYNTENDTLEPMTEENCHTEYWDADPDIYKPATLVDQIKVAFNALARWFKHFIVFIINKL